MAQEHYTYFIQIEDRIRAGSSVRVQLKLDGLREHYSKPFTLVAVVPEHIAEPEKVYALFDFLKARRGWLKADPELLYFIKGMEPYFVDPEQLERDRVKPIRTPAEQHAHDIVSQACTLRHAYGHDTPMGHACSNMTEIAPRLVDYVRPSWVSHESQTLPYLAAQQLKRIEQIKRAAA